MSKEPNKTITKESNELSAKENGEAVIDQQEAATNQQEKKRKLEDFNDSNHSQQSNLHSGFKPYILLDLLDRCADKEEVARFFEDNAKEEAAGFFHSTRISEIFSVRLGSLFLGKIDVNASYRSGISKKLMLRSDRVRIFDFFREKEIILPYQFFVNCLDFCAKSNDLHDIELASVLLGFLRSHSEYERGAIELEIFKMAAVNDNVVLITSLIKELIIGHKEEDGLEALHFAIAIGNLEIIELLLDNGADVNQLDKRKNSALHIAVIYRHFKIVELLLAKGAAINQENKDGYTPSNLAAAEGQLEIAEFLLQNGAEINLSGYRYAIFERLIHLATSRGHFEIVKLLLNNGADVNQLDEYGNTPLHLAAFKGYLEIVELLLAKGAAIDQEDKNGRTALSRAVTNGHTRIAAILIAKKVGVSLLDKPDELQDLYAVADKGYFRVIKFLLENGADPKKIADLKEINPLHLAAYNGDILMAKVLIVNEANVNELNQNGSSPLLIATIGGHLEIVELLLANGAAIDQKNNDGYTPPHFAVMLERHEIAKALAIKDPGAVIALLDDPLFKKEREKGELSEPAIESLIKFLIRSLEETKTQNPSTEIIIQELKKVKAEEKKGYCTIS